MFDVYDETHPDTLAIYCSDGRFTRAVEQLAAQLGSPRVDVMSLPGGPGLFDLWSASPTEARLMRDASSFLITGHRIQKVILVAHEGCGFYQRRYYSLDADERRARQEADVSVAREQILRLHPQVDVTGFFAAPSGTPSRVSFIPLSPR